MPFQNYTQFIDLCDQSTLERRAKMAEFYLHNMALIDMNIWDPNVKLGDLQLMAFASPEWVHLFCHTLDVISMNWYLETEFRDGTGEWDILREGFIMTFSLEDGFDCID